MNSGAVTEYIVKWLGDYLAGAGSRGFVVGISGGIDSAVVSALAAKTGFPTLCVTLPIHQHRSHVDRAEEHIAWLRGHFTNTEAANVDLTAAFDSFVAGFPLSGDEARDNLTSANTRARLRMTALYHFAGLNNMLVTGTGNKIEDFGIGFFTKYGDGGVDISPIADLTKSEVYELGRYLGVCGSILAAAPTDGLFGDDRSDADQIGASYPELEWAMEQAEAGAQPENFTARQREVFDIYVSRNRANRHKMTPIPYPKIPAEIK